MKQLTLIKPIVEAAERIFSRAYSQTLDFTKLREIVQATPLAVWNEFATFQIEERVEWKDDAPDSVSFIASFQGCEVAQVRAAALLLLLRGEAQKQNASKGTIKTYYRMVLTVPNTANSLHGWLDCETGKLQTGKGWPGLMAAMSSSPQRSPTEKS